MNTEPLPKTWLTLQRYAEIVSIPPPLMFGAVAPGSLYYTNACQHPVTRFPWQNVQQASRLDIASEIAAAEQEVSEYLGYNLAPDFLTTVISDYPQEYRPDQTAGWYGVRGQKAVALPRGKVISGGVRAVTLLDTVSDGDGLAFSDGDGDGFNEVVTITVTTSVTDIAEIQVFYEGHDGEPEYEIGKPFEASISGGTYTAKFYLWQIIDPDVDSRWPDGGYVATDMTVSSNLVSELDVYRVYVDNTVPYVRIFAQDNYYNNPDVVRGADGVFAIHDSERGLVIPTPATYDDDEEVWVATDCPFSGPTRVRTSYYSGDMSQRFLGGRTADPLKHEYARAIAFMVTARLYRPACQCTEPLGMYNHLKRDMTELTSGGGFLLTRKIESSQFGTRVGEVEAWRMINSTHVAKPDYAVI